MRTASLGGNCPLRRYRRTFAYEAVSTSIENVESGARLASRKGFSLISAYRSPEVSESPYIGASRAAIVDAFDAFCTLVGCGACCDSSVLLAVLLGALSPHADRIKLERTSRPNSQREEKIVTCFILQTPIE